ncbi:MAG TPA: signal peptidase II [Gemmatimonadaceae bacterium]|nr:signal peptidase II [Gemmatimonadaceae bacterium]
MNTKARRFWPLLSLLVVTDCTTKRLAETHLEPAHVPHEVFGEYVQFTLAHNPGAAFSISVGPMSRVVFSVLGVLVLVILWRLYRQTENTDRWQSIALALVAGGALGNLLDRIRSAKGVVDFIDIGFGSYRFWTFNFADVGVTAGGVLLAVLLLRRTEGVGASPPSGEST